MHAAKDWSTRDSARWLSLEWGETGMLEEKIWMGLGGLIRVGLGVTRARCGWSMRSNGVDVGGHGVDGAAEFDWLEIRGREGKRSGFTWMWGYSVG